MHAIAMFAALPFCGNKPFMVWIENLKLDVNKIALTFVILVCTSGMAFCSAVAYVFICCTFKFFTHKEDTSSNVLAKMKNRR